MDGAVSELLSRAYRGAPHASPMLGGSPAAGDD